MDSGGGAGNLDRLYRAMILSAVLALFCALVAVAKKELHVNPKTPQQEQACDFLLQGTKLLEAKLYFKARKPLEQAAALWPEAAAVHYNLGFCYNECALYDKAIYEFQRTLEIEPKMTDCLVNIGSCYQVQGKTAEAISFFQNYLKKNSSSPDAETVRGMIKALQKYDREHVESDPSQQDYLPSVSEHGMLRRWPYHRFPLRIYISNGTDTTGRPVNGFREEFNNLLIGALDDWVKASHNKIAYRVVTNPRECDIACTWTDDPAFLQDKGNKVEQGVAEVMSEPLSRNSTFKSIYSAHVRILVMSRDSGQPLTRDEMRKTCLHELGHALGMAGHSPSNKDVMFYSESSSVWPALTKRDKATMLRMYYEYPEMLPHPVQ